MKTLLGIILLTTAAVTSTAYGNSIYTLTDQNSIVEIDPFSMDGQYAWEVNGVDYLAKQWFWYRTGSDTQEYGIDTLNLTHVKTADINAYTGNEVLALQYTKDNDFIIDLHFTLAGAASGPKSDLAETITITNSSDSSLEFHFFQYVDLDLSPGGTNDTVWYPNDNTVRQVANTGVMASETVITPVSSHREANLYSATLTKLTNSSLDTLNDATSAGSGNVTWAYQWDVVIPASGSFQISKDKQITPEPVTALFLILGSIGLLTRRRA